MAEAVPVPHTGNDATDFSLDLLVGLVERGVRHLVVSPGSRSQALALVAAELERVGLVELHVRIDERVAGFLALGLALESGRPAVVVTTSGTATANLHPAVLEARASRVPMIVITSDRPAELRGIRANQTTEQPGLFGSAVAFGRDVHAEAGTDAAGLAAELWDAARRGPAHLNLALRDPLSAAVPDLSAVAAVLREAPRAAAASPAATESTPARLEPGPRTIVVAGNGAGAAAEELARAGGWPLIAEAPSGSRFGPNLVPSYRELLAHADFGGAVERAVVFGHPTLSREIPALLTRPGVEVIVVDDSGAPDFYDPGHNAVRVSAAAPAASVDPSGRDARAWTGSWVMTGRRLLDGLAAAEARADRTAPDHEAGTSPDHAVRAAYARTELAAVREPVTRRMLAEVLWQYTWPNDRLVLGASRLIRELDRAVPGKRITVRANRGLAGIDGTVATALGVGLALSDAGDPARPEPVRPGATRVLLGDLTLLHDVGALLRTPGERMPPIQVVVGNDHGGTIFAGLEVGRSAPAAAFERVQLTPREVDLAALAQAYGWRYLRAATRGELDRALSAVTPEPTLVEVPLD